MTPTINKGTITIKNSQRAIQLDIPGIQKIVEVCLKQLDYADFDLGIWFTTPSTIRKYNAQYRGIDKSTDILSFAYHPHLKPGKRIVVTMPEDKNLGDLILCPSYIQQKAAEYKEPFTVRLHILLVHGICHLLGYDHEHDKDYRQMQRLEQKLLALINQSVTNKVD